MQETGLTFLGAPLSGKHFCQFYHQTEDILEATIPFILTGLEKNEFCVWIKPVILPPLKKMPIRKNVLKHLESAVEGGQLKIFSESDWYADLIQASVPSSEIKQVEKVQDILEKIDAWSGVRGVGGMHRVPRSAWRNTLKYEKLMQAFMQNHEVLSLCTYSLSHCPIQNISKIISEHDQAFLKKGIHWEVVNA